MHEDWLTMGPPSNLSEVRSHAVLRQLRKSARQQARPAFGHPVIASAEPGERWLYGYLDEGFAE